MPTLNSSTQSVARLIFERAFADHQAGQYHEARLAYLEALVLMPDHPSTLYNLAMVELDLGRPYEASKTLDRAINAGLDQVNSQIGRAQLARAFELPLDAADHYRQALELKPDLLEALDGLAGALSAAGLLVDAEAPARRLVEISETADAHVNLASILYDLGKKNDAIVHNQLALVAAPYHGGAHNNLGNILREVGRIEEARTHLKEAIRLTPNLAAPLHNLAFLEINSEHWGEGLDLAVRALAINETTHTRYLIAQCLSEFRGGGNAKITSLMRRALSEGWMRTEELSPAACSLILESRVLEAFHDKLSAGKFLDQLVIWSTDKLLLALLCSAPIANLDLECILTRIRARIISLVFAGVAPPKGALPFLAALATQCIINEYIFEQSEREYEFVEELRATFESRLGTGAEIAEYLVASLMCYQALHNAPEIAKLVSVQWTAETKALIDLAISAPFRERALRDGLKSLTPVQSAHSQTVREHYEENPYPRWIRTGTMGEELGLASSIRRAFPYAKVEGVPEHSEIDILIAGCGSGQQAIETALRFPRSRIVAFDLSLSGLAYARRQAEVYKLANIQFMQGDVLALDSVEEKFDMVISTGVLVLIEDPYSAWRLLEKCLVPGGILHVAFYSDYARSRLNKAQMRANSMGLGTVGAVRRFRRELLADTSHGEFDAVFDALDFFSVSGCLDMLAPVRENRFTIPDIGTYLNGSSLRLLGFQVRCAVLEKYRSLNSSDSQGVDLDLWDKFERQNPSTFMGMYQLWMQRRL